MNNTHRMTALAAVAGIGAAALWYSRTRGPVYNPHVPEPNKDVELDTYMGRWYEMARYENRFERGCDGVTAEYTLRHDGLIDIVNRSASDAQGKPRQSHGKARVVQDSRNAKLEVSFFGPFYVGDYWVLDHAEDYQWSIVGEPSGRYLWILTRMPDPDPELRSMLVHRVAELGYDPSQLRMTDQSVHAVHGNGHAGPAEPSPAMPG